MGCEMFPFPNFWALGSEGHKGSDYQKVNIQESLFLRGTMGSTTKNRHDMRNPTYIWGKYKAARSEIERNLMTYSCAPAMKPWLLLSWLICKWVFRVRIKDTCLFFHIQQHVYCIGQTTTTGNQHIFCQHVGLMMFVAISFCITAVNSEKHSFSCWRQVSRALVLCLVVSTWTKAPRGWRSRMSRWREMQQHMRQLVPVVPMALSYYS